MAVRKISYTGGLNTMASLQGLPEGQLASLTDFIMRGNSLVSRNGVYQLGTNAAGVASSGLFYYIDASANEWFIMYGSTTHIYAIKNVSGALTFTDIIGGATLGVFSGYAVLNGILFIGSGTTGIWKWNGTGNISAVGGSSPTAVGSITVVNNFLFASGYFTSSVYWSNASDGTTWSVASTLDFRKGDGDFITELSSIGSDLIIFKGLSTGRLSTTTTTVSGAVTLAPLTTISESQGCYGSNASDKLPDGRIILAGSDSHAYIFDGSIFTDISDRQYPLGNIQNSFEGLGPIGTGNFKVFVNPILHEALFTIIVSAVSTNYYYDYINGIWSKRSTTPFLSAHYCVSNSSGNRGFKTINGTTVAVRYTQAIFAVANGVGGLFIDDVPGLNDMTGDSNTMEMIFSFNLPADDRDNTLVQLLIPFKCSAASKTLTYFVGRNGTYGSSKFFTTTGGIDRLKISLVFANSDSSVQVKVQCSTTDTWTFDDAYVSNDRTV